MFQTIRKYFIWIVLIIAILVVQIQKLLKRFNKEADLKENDNKSLSSLNLFCYIIAGLCIVWILYDLLVTTKSFKDSQNKVEEAVTKKDTKLYTDTYNKSEYDRITKETTEREIAKLKNNKKYIEMMEKRANNANNTSNSFVNRSYTNGNKENENNINDINDNDSDMNLSQIILSPEKN